MSKIKRLLDLAESESPDFSSFWSKMGGKKCDVCKHPEGGHGPSCPERWRTETRKCDTCGKQFKPEYKVQHHCSTACAKK